MDHTANIVIAGGNDVSVITVGDKHEQFCTLTYT